MKLRSRFLIIVSAFTIVCIFGISIVFTTELLKFWRGESEKSVADTKKSVASYIEQTIETAEVISTLIKDDELTARYFDLNEDDRYFLLYPAISRYLNTFLEVYPFIQEISLLNGNGEKEVRISRYQKSLEDAIDTDSFYKIWAEGAEAERVIEFHADSRRYALNVYQSIRLPDRSKSARKTVLKSVILISVDLNYIRQFFDNHFVGNNGKIAITRDQGVFVNIDDGQLGNKKEVFDEENYLIGKTAILEGWNVTIAIPKAVVVEQIKGIAIKSSIFLAVFFGLVGVIFYYTLKLFVIAPIGELNKAVELFSTRGIVSRFNDRNDEIGILQTEFSLMSEKIRLQNVYLREQAYTDILTGLPNRNILDELLSAVIDNADKKEQKVALLFIDLDGFKQVNDVLGHSAGDTLLQKVAERLNNIFRVGDIISRVNVKDFAEKETLLRIGGDEFTIILPNVKAKENAAKISDRLLEQFQQPFRIMGRDVYVGASIGIAMFPYDSNSSKDLVSYADTAMYAAKNAGKMRYSFFLPSMFDESMARLQLEKVLHNALHLNELFVVYQAKVDIQNYRVIGFEILARLETKTLGLVPPNHFIPVAEEIGLLDELTLYIIESACRTIMLLQSDLGRSFSMAINITPKQLSNQELFEAIHDVIASYGVSPELIELEVTENSLIDNEESAEKTLRLVKEKGFRTALDDFGVGYSSLGHLKRFQFDTIKIDRLFFKDIENDKNGEAILISIIQLAKQLNMVIVAEGIETEEQLEFVRINEVELVQGYIFSKPLIEDDLKQRVLDIETPAQLPNTSLNEGTLS